jgi:hypothetical protein
LPRELTKTGVIACMASWKGQASTVVLNVRVLKIFARGCKTRRTSTQLGVVGDDAEG